MKPAKFFIILLLAAVGVSAFISYVFPSGTGSPKPVVKEDKKKDNSKDLIVVNPTNAPKSFQPIAPVIPLATYRREIELEDLELERLVATKEVADYLTAKNGLTVVAIGADEIDSELADGSVALLLPWQVTSKHKTLYLDGQNIWKKGFSIDTYPLVAEVEQDHVTWDSASKLQMFVSGEIIPARAVDRTGLNVTNNYTYLYDFFAEDIKNADVSIAMLENSLLGDPTPCSGCTVFVGDEKNLAGFEEVGFDLFSLAGNHAGDGGQEAMNRTLELFGNSSIQATGLGLTPQDALKPAIREVNGKRVGLIAADDIAYFYWVNEQAQTLGINTFSYQEGGQNYLYQDQIRSVKAIKAANNLDILIAYMSWGIEYTNSATEYQQQIGHALIDNGVDIVVGSHPHWVQNIEFYQNKPIIYSVGNFIFDQTHTIETRQSVALNMYVYEGELKFIEIMPMQVCGYHQTSEDLTQRYLAGELTKQMVYDSDETSGCVYWQPKKLDPNHISYSDILGRMYENTFIDY